MMNSTDNISVLLVDDDSFYLDMLQNFLKPVNCGIVTAENGQQALDILNQKQSTFNAILLDWEMPEIDGLSVLKKIKADSKWKLVPVIMETARSSREEIQTGLDNGARYYITKPFTQENLCNIVKSAIEEYNGYLNLQQELEKFSVGLKFLTSASFIYRTLSESQNISMTLANAFNASGKIVLGLSELLLNAIEHGNLAIGYEEKSELLKSGKLYEVIEKRLQMPENKDKFVRVDFFKKEHFAHIIIEDQGEGFQWQDYEEYDPIRAFDMHGRGIMTAKNISFDKLIYHGKGNKVEAMIDLIKDRQQED